MSSQSDTSSFNLKNPEGCNHSIVKHPEQAHSHVLSCQVETKEKTKDINYISYEEPSLKENENTGIKQVIHCPQCQKSRTTDLLPRDTSELLITKRCILCWFADTGLCLTEHNIGDN